MGHWSITTTHSAAGAAISALLLGMLHHFPTGVLLLGTSIMLMPTFDDIGVVHSFSAAGHPVHPRRTVLQKSKFNTGKNTIGTRSVRSGSTTDENENEQENKNTVRSIRNEEHEHEDAFCFAPNPKNRRGFLRDQFIGGGLAGAATLSTAGVASSASALLWASNPRASFASNPKSRTEGYAVQHTEREWAYLLSGAQYNILRKGGTERQKASILNTFTATDNVGTYVCAACQTALFDSASKFSSGTGWPSFAKALDGVEEEKMGAISATLGGKEVRCGTCGGHLGDLFNDGWVYLGTQAFETGNRYCIDGAALVFQPSGGGGEEIYGDQPPPNKVINYEQSLFRDNSINSRQ